MGSEQQPGSQQPGSYLEACGVGAASAARSSDQEEGASPNGSPSARSPVGAGRPPHLECHQGGRHSSMDEVRRLLCSLRCPHCHEHALLHPVPAQSLLARVLSATPALKLACSQCEVLAPCWRPAR